MAGNSPVSSHLVVNDRVLQDVQRGRRDSAAGSCRLRTVGTEEGGIMEVVKNESPIHREEI